MPVTKPSNNVVSVSSLDSLRNLAPEVEGAVFEDRSFRRHANESGTLGGFVESTAKASKSATIGFKSLVLELAVVSDSAEVHNSIVKGNANVCNLSKLYNSTVLEHAIVRDFAKIYNSTVTGNAVVRDAARLDNATVTGNALVCECARLKDGIVIGGTTMVGSDINNNTYGFGYGSTWTLFKASEFDEAKPLLRSEVGDVDWRKVPNPDVENKKARIRGLLARIYEEIGREGRPEPTDNPYNSDSDILVFTINIRRYDLNVEMENAFLKTAGEFRFKPKISRLDICLVPEYELIDSDGIAIRLEPDRN